MEYQNQSKYECLLFDVDDTLYPLSSGLSAQCTKNIIEYMGNELDIDESKVLEMNGKLYREYGTSMAGLRAFGYDFDYDNYHSFVHGRLPYENLKPDPVLRSLLHSLPIRKVGSVIGYENDSELPESPIVCKPFENAFQQAFKLANINPRKTLFFDDSIRNIQTSKLTGLTTVLVGSSQRKTGVDYALESIHNIREALPELWEGVSKSLNVSLSQKIAMETPVEA
ncbi:hypothetical protein M8C21_033452 [Ambrosia artemisiifolia]|uniref:Uncharacterized protein n=1 Tax=Ambrosia artemisiifolia TaxID=4212 RepID=A0AAD5BMC6_AMBAR|nr:hypothetical protein M8C21_033452 [Ambrosia artemisiifolia]